MIIWGNLRRVRETRRNALHLGMVAVAKTNSSKMDLQSTRLVYLEQEMERYGGKKALSREYEE